ncbi:MAG: aldehyde dehydrogenase [Symbiobacteriaceae bacterium]|jgi:aldehyde dehydrogenase (NAD+)/succinate-semialdehyde dehydrogenase/glutarate-semialdehyde dehydrogenase|nr:aldehyde dehydrogenase [Symbiobacteriaceae bacterium]
MVAFAEALWAERARVLEILTETTTHRFAVDELTRSIRALYGALEEMGRTRPRPVQKLAVYMPSNVLLYSYVLYGVIPLLYAGEVVLRPSAKVESTHMKLNRLLRGAADLPIRFAHMTQREFWECEVANADVIVFTGSYENGCQIAAKAARDQLFLFFGSGVNPMIAGAEADVETVVRDAVTMRTLNSGQDCICPDVIFVHRRIARAFRDQLISEVSLLPIGSREDPEALITPLYYPKVASSIGDYVAEYREKVVYGGAVDAERRWVPPTILFSDLAEMPAPVEYFAPIFNVVVYDDDEQLLERLAAPQFTESGMGISIYGAPWLATPLSKWHTVALDRSFLDLENGNRPFGGFGPRANFGALNGQRWARPMLISNEVARAPQVGRLRSW